MVSSRALKCSMSVKMDKKVVRADLEAKNYALPDLR